MSRVTKQIRKRGHWRYFSGLNNCARQSSFFSLCNLSPQYQYNSNALESAVRFQLYKGRKALVSDILLQVNYLLFTCNMYTNIDLKALRRFLKEDDNESTFSSSIYIQIKVIKFTEEIILIIISFTLVIENIVSTLSILFLRPGCSICCLQGNVRFNLSKFAGTMFAHKNEARGYHQLQAWSLNLTSVCASPSSKETKSIF